MANCVPGKKEQTRLCGSVVDRWAWSRRGLQGSERVHQTGGEGVSEFTLMEEAGL